MSTNFDPQDGGKVSREEAEKWIKKFDDDRHDKEKDTKSIFFGKDFLKKILETPECAGISFFFAKKHNAFAGKETLNLVLVPRRADGTLIWAKDFDGKDGDSGESGYNQGKPCPPSCS
jgi:hypothetical protein